MVRRFLSVALCALFFAGVGVASVWSSGVPEVDDDAEEGEAEQDSAEQLLDILDRADGLRGDLPVSSSVRPEEAVEPVAGVSAGLYDLNVTARSGAVSNTTGRTIYLSLNPSDQESVNENKWDFKLRPGESIELGNDLPVMVETVGVYFEYGALTDGFEQRLVFWPVDE